MNNKQRFTQLVRSMPAVKKKFKRTTGYYIKGGTTFLHSTQEIVTGSPVFVMFPESVLYLFHLDAGAKNLFFFLTCFHTDKQTGLVRVDDSTKLGYLEYCKTFSTEYQDSTIKQALATLVKANVLLNLGRFQYMVNPMVAGPINDVKRRLLIREYSKQLIEKEKNADKDFYPIFEKK
jgi:hypothetical protein